MRQWTLVVLCIVCVALVAQASRVSIPITSESERVVSSGQCEPNAPRRDCGYVGITQQQCQAKGCCWNPYKHYAWCFYPSAAPYYVVSSVQNTAAGLQFTLSGNGTAPALYGSDISPLTVSVTMETQQRLRVKIVDSKNGRWEVPREWSPDTQPPSHAPSTMDYNFEHAAQGEVFWFRVTRASTGEVLFDTQTTASNGLPPLVFEDQFLQLSTVLQANPNIYGLGERIRQLRLDIPGRYTMWNYDIPDAVNDNLYGSHPFYMDVRQETGNAHGVFLRNSNGMDVHLDDGMLTYNTIGGVLDLYIFTGPTPDSVIQQYTDVIGKPYLPPMWTLGFHLCRYGYHNVSELDYVVTQMAQAKIPLEVMWTDIDYMDAYKDWTFDPVNFPVDKMNALVSKLHQNNQKYVVIVDPGIHNEQGYKPYDSGIQEDIFIKDAQGQVFIGKVWPGTTAFPDFLNPKANAWWAESIQDFLNLVPVDSLWIDMNEISNFCNGACSSSSKHHQRKQQRVAGRPLGFDPNNPPYAINNQNNHASLETKTVAMDAVHFNNTLEYDIHNLFGLSEAIATKAALDKIRGKRSFVLSRSTWPSSGAHTSHWTGDNTANWDYLYYNIPGVLQFNMFGIPQTGSDICGFLGDTTEELCTRWMAMGSFMPFMRNHNTKGAAPQEPFRWPQVAQVSTKYIGIRYRLLAYYYTLLHTASQTGSTMARPLFFEWPADTTTLGIDKQFLLGSSLMVAPVITQGATSVSVYFPKANWYELESGRLVVSAENATQTITVSAPIDFVPAYIRGGSILPMLTDGMTVHDTMQNPMGMLVAPDDEGDAQGSLYLDDGESLSPTTVLQSQFTLSMQGGQGTIAWTTTTASLQTPKLMNIELLSTVHVTSASLNGAAIASSDIVFNGAATVFSNLNAQYQQSGKLTFSYAQ